MSAVPAARFVGAACLALSIVCSAGGQLGKGPADAGFALRAGLACHDIAVGFPSPSA